MIENENKEFSEHLVTINRVAKVVKGGRRFGFAAIMIVGDNKGRVGYGTGKAKEVPEAVRKAAENAKNKMVRVHLKDNRTLHHDVVGFEFSKRPIVGKFKKGFLSTVIDHMIIEQFLPPSSFTEDPCPWW